MSEGSMAELASELEGRLVGGDVRFSGVSTDSRELTPGSLFVALVGERFDGHDFLPQAAARGAAGGLVERAAALELPQIVVDDTRSALGRHAQLWRQRFDLPVLAVTGSNGKTTVKEMIAGILRVRGPVLATRGNLNNDIGLPLTLLELDTSHWAAVIEMGTNHPGEIGYLARLTAPELAVITNAAPAHLEGFGTVEAVAREKGAAISALAPEGTAVINADDRHVGLWRELAGRRRVVSFGASADADFRVRGVEQRVDARGVRLTLTLHCPLGHLVLDLPLAGLHNAGNAACAAAAAWAAGATADEITGGLAHTPAVHGRLRVRTVNTGARVIDDSYNANPSSMKAAIDFLASLPGPGWLVMGDMAELGPEASALHFEVGLHARRRGLERLFAIGPLSRHAAAAFGSGAETHADVGPAVSSLKSQLHGGVNVLVKASRSARLERVVQALAEGAGSTESGEEA